MSRLGDVISTYLASPKLKLETNPIVRKFRWPFAILTILVCFVPYYDTDLAVIILIPFLLVCSSNIGELWIIRTLGEDEFKKFMLAVCRKGEVSKAMYYMVVSNIFFSSVGALLILLHSKDEWAALIGGGIMLYASIIIFYKVLFFLRLDRQANKERYEMMIKKVDLGLPTDR